MEKAMMQSTNKAWWMGLVTALALTFGSTAALADKDHGDRHHKHKHDDDDRGGKHAWKHKHKKDRREARVGRYFDDEDRRTVRVYYVEHYGGHKACPPGLMKKKNACVPPHAKRYDIGRPLPTTVVYYPVPQPVLVQLPPPPVGHKYVRVAADILLIAVGTSIVVDAVTDLSKL
jgi:Ni/Co efflux regulator RcnB